MFLNKLSQQYENSHSLKVHLPVSIAEERLKLNSTHCFDRKHPALFKHIPCKATCHMLNKWRTFFALALRRARNTQIVQISYATSLRQRFEHMIFYPAIFMTQECKFNKTYIFT